MKQINIIWDKMITDNSRVVNQIDLGNGTCFTIISFIYHIPFKNGRRLFVGIERKGAFFFPTTSFISGEYVSEKLNLYLSDANIIADWINFQIDKFTVQQGEYLKEYIEENIGNNSILSPIILPLIEQKPDIICEHRHEGVKTFYDDH